jgi:glycosyltransferase involved in cell wall biosynthesis
MNVLLTSYQALSTLHGGPRTQLHNTARFLPDYGVSPHLFDAWKPLKKGEYDLVHLFAANIGTYHLAREIHVLDIPLVVSPIIYSLHSPSYIRTVLKGTRLLQKVGRGIWTDYALAADICSWSKCVLPNTRDEALILEKGLGVAQPKISVIPNGVDERFANADPSLFEEKYGLREFILNVGHTGHRRKNVLTLIKALGKIDHPSVIIGRIIAGSYGDACVREAAKHKQILLIDGLENESDLLASAYAACDTFILPSLFETPGIAALEAGLAGAKIVITPHGGTKEYFGTMAKYVDPYSVDSIRNGIIASLQSEKSTMLREHIRKEFLWPRVAEKTAVAYKKAAA